MAFSCVGHRGELPCQGKPSEERAAPKKKGSAAIKKNPEKDAEPPDAQDAAAMWARNLLRLLSFSDDWISAGLPLPRDRRCVLHHVSASRNPPRHRLSIHPYTSRRDRRAVQAACAVGVAA